MRYPRWLLTWWLGLGSRSSAHAWPRRPTESQTEGDQGKQVITLMPPTNPSMRATIVEIGVVGQMLLPMPALRYLH